MSLSRAEGPGAHEKSSDSNIGAAALPRVTRLNRGLYAAVLYVLGAALLLLIVGWIVLAALGRMIPENLPVVIATIVGALAGVIASDREGAGKRS